MLQYRSVAEELSLDTARRTSDLAETLKTQVIRNAYSTLHAMSGFQRVRGLNAKTCSDVAHFFLENSTGYSNIGSVLPNGDVYCAARSTPGRRNIAGQPWLMQALKTGEFTMGDYLVSPVTHNGIVAFALPIKDADGKIQQVLTAALETAYIQKVVSLPNLPEDSSVMVIDRAGNVLATNKRSGVSVGENIASWDVAKSATTADKPFAMEGTGPDGESRVFAVTASRVSRDAVPEADAKEIRSISIIVGIPARKIVATVMAPLKSSGAAIGIVFAIILLGTYFFIGRTIVQPLQSIQTAAERLTLGNLKARVAFKPRSDEIGALANAFNIMASVLARREADLRRSNERVQRIFDTEPAGVTLLDHNLNILDMNKVALENMGVTDLESLRGKKLPPLVVDEDRPRYEEHVKAVLGGETHTTTVQIVDLQGKRRWLELHAAAIQLDEEAPSAYIAIARDKTEELATAAQLVQAQKMESVGRLTGGVAHDFNNLLTIMMGNAEILSERLEDQPDLANLARMIEAATQRGAELTHRMLAFARRQVLRPAELDVNALLSRMVDMMGRILGEDIRIRIDTAEKLWCVAADPAQMESAILNLAINARDAMPQGGTLTIETQNTHLDADYIARNPEAAVGDYILIAISDSGTGMPPEVLDRAFDPFFTTKEVGKGSGLGLSMVYGFVKQSHGHIKIYSEAAHGTTVRIYLPRSTEAGESQENVAEILLDDAKGTEIVLVVEDEEAVRVYVTQQLRGLGYTVIEAADSQAALAILESDVEIDLLFTDVVLPGGMNGRQLAEIGTRARPSLKVLFTTGYTENAVVHHGKLDAGVELLSKPYRRAELARHVRKVIEKA
ncbi:MAG TPA: ATP-binding protein [Parvibaculum sp.]